MINFDRLFFFVLVSILITSNSCLAQFSDSTKWAITVTAGIEAHDKRLGSLARKEFLLETQKEFFGTYSLAAGLQRQKKLRKKIGLSYGMDLIYSKATFRRPYVDASVPTDVAQSDIFLWVDDYRELLFAPTVGVQRSMTKRLSLGLLSQVKFRFHLYMKDAGNRVEENYRGPWGIQFRSLNFFGNVTFKLNDNFRIVGRYRFAQLLHNDPNLMNRLIFSPANPDVPPPPRFQFFNPVRLEVAFSYQW